MKIGLSSIAGVCIEVWVCHMHHASACCAGICLVTGQGLKQLEHCCGHDKMNANKSFAPGQETEEENDYTKEEDECQQVICSWLGD